MDLLEKILLYSKYKHTFTHQERTRILNNIKKDDLKMEFFQD